MSVRPGQLLPEAREGRRDPHLGPPLDIGYRIPPTGRCQTSCSEHPRVRCSTWLPPETNTKLREHFSLVKTSFVSVKINTYLWASQVAQVVNNPLANAGDAGDSDLISGRGRFPWRRAWQPTTIFSPGKFHGQRSLAGYNPWGHKESDMTDLLSMHTRTQGCSFLGTDFKWKNNIDVLKFARWSCAQSWGSLAGIPPAPLTRVQFFCPSTSSRSGETQTLQMAWSPTNFH